MSPQAPRELPRDTLTSFTIPASGGMEERMVSVSGIFYAECDGDGKGGVLYAHGLATGATQWPIGLLVRRASGAEPPCCPLPPLSGGWDKP